MINYKITNKSIIKESEKNCKTLAEDGGCINTR